MIRSLWIALVLLGIVLCSGARADVFRPAYLEIRERAGGEYAVLWKVPAQGPDTRLALQVAMPSGTVEVAPRRGRFVADAYVEEWRIRDAAGLSGRSVCIHGKAAGATDVLARIQRLDGSEQVERISAGTSCFSVVARAGALEVARTYTKLGIRHILGGVDHLLFVLALLLILRGGKRIFLTITAFTVAHSVTLVAATLGWLRVPGPPVEAAIALSIVFVASEIVRAGDGHPGLTARAPWLVAFSFGLLHGLGFAGALAEVGLPAASIPVALLCFNVGVEIGQLAFVAAVLAAIAVCRSLRPIAVPRFAASVPPYAIGTLAMFWVCERIAAF